MNIWKRKVSSLVVKAGFVTALVAAASVTGFGQAGTASNAKPTPFVTELKGISLGMTIDQVKEVLGKPKSSDKTGLFYKFSDGETAQIGVDAKKNVRTIALIFTGEDANAPEFADIFGSDVPMIKRKDGGTYKMIRYSAAGFWTAYSRIVTNKKPMTTITMRKIPKP